LQGEVRRLTVHFAIPQLDELDDVVGAAIGIVVDQLSLPTIFSPDWGQASTQSPCRIDRKASQSRAASACT
jgi:hypothetical protein